jgi:hypothetical protein
MVSRYPSDIKVTIQVPCDCPDSLVVQVVFEASIRLTMRMAMRMAIRMKSRFPILSDVRKKVSISSAER